MTPEQIVGRLVFYGVAALGVVLLLWWFSDTALTAIRAPVVRELDKAVGANASLKTDNDRLLEQNGRLDKLLTNRAAFEKKVDDRFSAMGKTLADLKKSNAHVRKWAETRIPDAVLQ